MSEPANTQPADANASEQRPTPTAADQKPATEPSADKLFTQADIDRIVTERLSREEKKRAEVADKARREAEEKSLAENAKWQELAEKRAKDLEAASAAMKELESAKATSEAQAQALGRYLDAERKGLPDHIIGLLDKLPPLQQLEWLAENKEKLATPKPATEADKRSAAAEPSQDWQKIAAQKFGIRAPQ